MTSRLFLVMGVVGVATMFAPGAKADSFTFNYDYCSNPCLGGNSSSNNGGTVDVTNNNTTSVTITVNLSSLDFHQTSGLDAFMFNAISSSSISVSGLTSGFEFNGTNTSGAISATNTHEDGAGTFQYIICYDSSTTCPQSNQGSGVDGSTLTFTLTSSSDINVETTNGGASVTDFAANVTTGTCTGLIGAGNGTSQSTATTSGTGTACTSSTVPEPTSILLLGTALAFVGKLLKARLAA